MHKCKNYNIKKKYMYLTVEHWTGVGEVKSCRADKRATLLLPDLNTSDSGVLAPLSVTSWSISIAKS